MYSAVKQRGKPLYQLARAGITVPRKSRKRWIYRLELIDWQPPVATIEVECSRGTYIRTLADDLGKLLGCGAMLKDLTRLSCGIFTIGDAVSLPQLEEAFARGHGERLLYPIDSVLGDLPAIVLDEAAAEAMKNGRPLSIEVVGDPPTPIAGHRCCVYSRDGGVFLGTLRFDAEKGQWRPEKVFTAHK
jgi:tRNA pseudouridine55 synthase